MQTIRLGHSKLEVSRLVYGCMRIAGDGSAAARDRGKRAVRAALEAGYTLFDHADLYGDGACEALFGELLRESRGLRDEILVASKCGIRVAADTGPDAPKRYDFSAEYIENSVHGSLRRLGVDRLDLFLLHRPDYLMRADEVAEALQRLLAAGKIAHIGVSNFSASQFELLQISCAEPLVVNQVEINIHNVDALDNGVLDQCQRLGVTPQAWCPLAGVAYEPWGNTFTADDERRLRKEFERQARHYQVADWVIALAWLLKHPAGISPIIGSTTPKRIAAARQALDVDYSREDWYRLLEARNGQPVP